MKVIVAMSGGVDSSVAAYLLKESHYEVIGAYFKMLDSEKGLEDAEGVAAQLKIPLITVDIKDEFKKEIIDDFIQQYKMGFTPNPCVKCNEKIKFGVAYEKARSLVKGALFATGHYAIIEKNKEVHLKKGVDKTKDQSYMLWRLNREQLRNSILPLGTLTKSVVYDIAKNIHLKFSKRESQDVCFINGKLVEFLRKYIKEKEGDIVSTDGTVLGKHKGVYFYTIGQRSGLGISYSKPLYVVRIDVKRNRIVVGEREECYFKFAEITETNFIESWGGEERVLTAKVRYRSKESECLLKKNKNKVIVEFKEKQFAIAPGQSLVLFDRDYVFGGGIIKNVY